MTPKAFVGSVSMLHACNQAKDLKQEIPEDCTSMERYRAGGAAAGEYIGYGFQTMTSTKTSQNSIFS